MLFSQPHKQLSLPTSRTRRGDPPSLIDILA